MSLNHATVTIDELQELDLDSMTELNVIEPQLFLLQKKSNEAAISGFAENTISISGILSVSF